MTMDAEIAAGFRKVAEDQYKQDIDNKANFATKEEAKEGKTAAESLRTEIETALKELITEYGGTVPTN